MDWRNVIKSGTVDNMKESLHKCVNVHRELMAQNAVHDAGLLMLAVTTGNVEKLEVLANAIKTRLGTTLLAKQLRYEDDTEATLLFYAAERSFDMFLAASNLVEETIGRVGLAEQLRHHCAKGMNILMKASSDPKVFAKAWDLAKKTNCLDNLLDDEDREGRNWVLHSAKAGNLAVLERLHKEQRELYSLFNKKDRKQWNGFMYAARGKGGENGDFFKELCKMCFSGDNDSLVCEQLRRVASDEDESTLMMRAAIGGRKPYAEVCGMIQRTGCRDSRDDTKRHPVLLSSAAKGGDVQVLNAVAKGIKTGNFCDVVQDGKWHDVSSPEEAARLLRAIRNYAKRREEVSLFLSAIGSGCSTMINAVLVGIKALEQDPKDCWEILCGNGGNPLTIAAKRTTDCFRATFEGLQGVASQDSMGILKREIVELLLPTKDQTPLCSAVLIDDSDLFDEVLKQANVLYTEYNDGALYPSKEILQQVDYAMRDDKERLGKDWISANMLAKVLQAAKDAGKGIHPGFDVKALDYFVELALSNRAFYHIRELINNGCDLVMHFQTLLAMIAENETDTTECIMLAITAARSDFTNLVKKHNPFVEYGIISKAMYGKRYTLNHAALNLLHRKIGDLTLELLKHLPKSVSGVGEELAQGDPELEPFIGHVTGKIKPSELLGFVVVEWMLEGSSQTSVTDDRRPLGVDNSLAQAVISGPHALDLLSRPFIMDYLRLKFRRTLPSWSTQTPFQCNINQEFYSYTHKATAKAESDETKEGVFQRLLLLLQGWDDEELKLPYFPHCRTVLPGMQFTLAGIMGKPVSYYVVPAVRMLFVVINYLVMAGLYISCVSLQSQHVPPNEWAFYVMMLGVAWREGLEFSNVSNSELKLEASIERYFCDKWNVLDVATIGMVFVAFTSRMIELATERFLGLFIAQFFLAATAPLLFSRLLFLSQVGSALGPMTQVIFNMMTALVQFSVVLLLVMIGFAASFSALYGENTVLVERNLDDCDVKDHPIVEAFGTLPVALLTMFRYMLGEFSFEEFYDRYQNVNGNDCGGVAYEAFGVALLATYLVITAVMLLNLLIAVLGKAYSEIQKNALKEFQLARAKIILQCGENVLNDAIPPPFNLVKPVVGVIFWLPSLIGKDEVWARHREIATGTIHRTIFWFVVGLVALAITVVLWVVSIPMLAWNIYQEQSDRQKKKEVAHQATNKIPNPPPYSLNADNCAALVERIFFARSSEGKGWILPTHLLHMLIAILHSVAFCLIVYPLLSTTLWLGGNGNLWHYVNQMKSKTSSRGRRQVDRGEEAEWYVARTHAVKRNERYRYVAAADSSENEFNVKVFLKTTTGMNLEDLRSAAERHQSEEPHDKQ